MNLDKLKGNITGWLAQRAALAAQLEELDKKINTGTSIAQGYELAVKAAADAQADKFALTAESDGTFNEPGDN